MPRLPLFALAALLSSAAAQEVPRLPQPAPMAADTALVVPVAPAKRPTADAYGAVAAPVAVPLSVEEAVEIALERGYAVRLAALDVATAEAQVREAYGELFPRVEGFSSYTRNVAQANPFAGSSAARLFSGGAATGWLQFNELARTDSDAATVPITLSEYNRRVGAGQDAIGFNPAASGNPFGTDNQFANTLSITQPLYSATAFAAVQGAQSLVEVNEAARQQQRDETIHQVRQLYYQAALAQAQVGVLGGSLERTRSTYDDAVLLVAQGVRPMLDQLNAEVDVANVRTQLATARTEAATAVDQLLLALGLPVATPVRLSTSLRVPSDDLFRVAALAPVDQGPVEGELAPVDLTGLALDERPDVRQAALAVELQQVQKNITEAATRPGLSAFANLSFSGNVPDDRTTVFAPDPDDPFTFEDDTAGFFSEDYWQPAVSVGLRLNWTFFDGFQTRYRAQQDQIAIDRARIRLEQVRNVASLEVTAAARRLQSAQERLRAQQQTVQTAETAYSFATQRLEVGVAPLLDVRLASDNLEQARLNLLQAAFDALVARSDYERATGTIDPTAVRPAEPFPALDPEPTVLEVVSDATTR